MATDLEDLVIQLTARTDQFQREMRKAVGDFDKNARQIERRQAAMRRKFESTFKGMSSAIIPSLGAIGAALSVREIAAYADKWTTAKNALRVAGLEGDNLTSVLDGLFASAQKNGVALNPLVGVYSKIAQVQDELGASTSDLTKFTDGVALSLKVAGTSAGAASGALLQLGQLLGGQKVQAQEYNSLIDGAYPLLQAVAAGTDKWGGSVARLTADVKAGNVTVQEFFRSALAGFPSLEKRADTAAVTISQAFQKLDNAFEKYVGEMNDANKGSDLLVGGLNTLAENIDGVVKAAEVLALTLGPAVLVGAIRSAVTAMGTLTAVIAANPLGAVAIALSAVAAALIVYKYKSDITTDAITQQADAHKLLNGLLGDGIDLTKALTEKEAELARKKLETAKATTKQALAQAEANLQQAKDLDYQNQVGGALLSPIGGGLLAGAGSLVTDKAKAQFSDEVKRLKANLAENEKDLARLNNEILLVTITPSKLPPGTPDSTSGGKASTKSGRSRSLKPVDITPRIGTEESQQIVAEGAERVRQYQVEADTIGMTAAQADAYRWKMQALSDTAKVYGTVTDEQRASIDAVAASMEQAGQKADDLHDAYAKSQYLQHQIVDGLGDIAVAGLHSFNDMKSAAADFLESLAEMILKLYVIKPLLESLGNSGSSGGSGGGGGFLGFLGSAIGSLLGGGGGISGVNVTPDVFGNFSGAYASGGTIPRGQFGLVGEDGPELAFAGPGGTQIMPSVGFRMPTIPDAKSGSTTPVSVVLSPVYNVQGSNRQEIEALLADHDRKLAKQLPGMVVKTVRDANSRRML